MYAKTRLALLLSRHQSTCVFHFTVAREQDQVSKRTWKLRHDMVVVLWTVVVQLQTLQHCSKMFFPSNEYTYLEPLHFKSRTWFNSQSSSISSLHCTVGQSSPFMVHLHVGCCFLLSGYRLPAWIYYYYYFNEEHFIISNRRLRPCKYCTTVFL